MKSFFAMCWNPDDARSDRHARQVQDLLRHSIAGKAPRANGPGLLILNLSDAPTSRDLIDIRDDRDEICGALFGRLFQRGDPAKPSASVSLVSRRSAAKLANSHGAALFEQYWGSYVGVGRTGRKFWIAADPLATIPCYYMLENGVLLAFSHRERCPFLRPAGYTFNRDFISLLLCYDKVQTGDTGLTEIRELMGGERLLSDGRTATTELIWDPRSIAARPLRLAVPEAAELLSQTTRASVASWAGCFDKIRLNLSGGLDSSIVASCLAACCSPSRLELVHQVMASSDQSEIGYARATADYLGLPLSVEVQSARTGLPDLASHPASVRPYRQFLASDTASSGAAEARPPIFTGQGGDHLYFVARLATIFADHTSLNGLSVDTAGQLFAAARLSGKSIWQVLRESVLAQASRQTFSPLARAVLDRKTALNASLSDKQDLLTKLPVWTMHPAGLPPAKFQQVNLLAHLVHMRRPLPSRDDREAIHPLMSQPLVELCLQLPTYLLAYGGMNRGLARFAFREAIPDSVRLRTTKGSAGRYYRSQATSHRNEIAAALLEGDLVARGIVDRNAVAAFFNQREDERHSYGHMALVYYTVEAWARRWRDAV